MSETPIVDAARRQPARVRFGQIVIATLIAVAALAVIWWMAVPAGPMVCPAVMPPPTNCMASHRAGTALVLTIAVAAVSLATIALAVTAGRRHRALVTSGIVVLAVLLLVAWPLIGLMSGFPLPGGLVA